MNRVRTMRVVAAAIVASAMNAAGAQTILRVNADAPAGGDGASWVTAYNTLQAALAAATAGTEIWVAAGTYSATTGLQAFQPTVPVSIYGGFSGIEVSRIQRRFDLNVTTLSGSGQRTVVAIRGLQGVIIDGFTITQGLGHGDLSTQVSSQTSSCPGGGMSIDSSTATVANCKFVDNAGGPAFSSFGPSLSNGDGGGALVRSSTVLFSGCQFSANRVGNVYLVDCVGGAPIIGGGVGSGAGIASVGSQLTVVACLFEQNFASTGFGVVTCPRGSSLSIAGGSGGAICALGGTLSVDRSTFLANRAGAGDGSGPNCAGSSLPGDGGAIYTEASASVSNSAFAMNSTPSGGSGCGGGAGAAICTGINATLTLVNCVLFRNTSVNANRGALSANTIAYNCIFWENANIQGETLLAQTGPTSAAVGYFDHCIIQGLTELSNGNRAVDPLFVDPPGPDGVLGTADDRFDLAFGSPGIDAGKNAPALDFRRDLLGKGRFHDISQVPDTGVGSAPMIDIGAIELWTCPVDLDNGSGTGTPDNAVTIDDLLYFLTAFEAGAPPADLDNATGTGVHDHAVTIDDLLFFLVHFEAGC